MRINSLYFSTGLLITTMLMLVSCASLGSRVTQIQPESLKQVECITLTEPVLKLKEGKKLIDVDDQIWIENARHRLLYAFKEHNLMDKICNDDLMTIIENMTLDQDDPALVQKAYEYNDPGASAVLTTRLEIKAGDNHKGDSEVIMRLQDINTNEIILELKFNTKWGVNYITKPTVIMSIRDGLSGAVQSLAESFEKPIQADRQSSKK